VRSAWADLVLKLLKWSAEGANSTRSVDIESNSLAETDVPRLIESKIDSLLSFALSETPARQRLYEKVWAVQHDVLRDAVTALDSASISSVIYKGAEFFARCYESRPLSIVNDIDLLVGEPQVSAVKKVLSAHGFQQARFDPDSGSLVDLDLAELANIEDRHYELVPFRTTRTLHLEEDETELARQWNRHPLWVVRDTVIVVVELDVHHAVAADLSGDEFFQRAVPSSLGFGQTMSIADHVWFTTSKYYMEVALHGKTSLRDFAYVAPLLGQPELDWDVVLAAAKEYELRPSLYYYLSFLDMLAGNVIPAKVLSQLNPKHGMRYRDWGWQLAKLLGGVDRFSIDGGSKPLEPFTA
jgi:hypothetical protein